MSALFLAAVLFVLTGCIPNAYTAQEEEDFLREAEKTAQDWLGTVHNGASVKSIEAETSVENAEYVLTEFASGEFVWQKKIYEFVVNINTGEVYTSVCFDELAGRLKEVLVRELGIADSESAAVSCGMRYLRGFENSRWGAGMSGVFNNVFPGEETADELFRKILEDPEEYCFAMDIQYKGEAIPRELLEGEAPFSTLSQVTVWHVAQEYDLYRGEYKYSTLPCLSEEILRRNYFGDSAKYVRNQTLERDGFRIVYNAYEEVREQGEVQASVIDEEDIFFSVTDEYIELRCAKENGSLYLSTEDRKLADRYRYAFDYIFSKEKTQKGMWFACEGRYFYADNTYVAAPHKFDNRHPESNIIYRRQRKGSETK